MLELIDLLQWLALQRLVLQWLALQRPVPHQPKVQAPLMLLAQ